MSAQQISTKTSASQRGTSFVETMVSVALLAILGGGASSMLMDSEGVFRASLQSSEARQRTVDSFDTIRRELEQANPVTLQVDGTKPNGDILTFQIPVGIVGNDVTWGATSVVLAPNGFEVQNNAGFFISFQLVNQLGGGQQLVRRVLDTAGNAFGADEVLARDVDLLSLGRGFQVQRTDDLVTVTLRLRLTNTDTTDPGAMRGDDVMRTQTTLIRLRTD